MNWASVAVKLLAPVAAEQFVSVLAVDFFLRKVGVRDFFNVEVFPFTKEKDDDSVEENVEDEKSFPFCIWVEDTGKLKSNKCVKS